MGATLINGDKKIYFLFSSNLTATETEEIHLRTQKFAGSKEEKEEGGDKNIKKKERKSKRETDRRFFSPFIISHLIYL